MVYLAIDPGLSHTGVAISSTGQLAEGLTTLHQKDPLNSLLTLIKQHQPDCLIIGRPSRGPLRDFAQQLANRIGENTDIPTQFVEEDFSSRQAQTAQIHSGKGRIKRHQQRHQAAAAAILQFHLDSLLK